MAEIALSKGYVTVVDDADFEWLSQWKWSSCSEGYAVRRINRRPGPQISIYMHRLILPAPIGFYTDHRNRNRLDNRRANLRIANPTQNSINRPYRNCSGYRGVAAHRGRWRAQVSGGGGSRHIGVFDTPEEAARAYDEAAVRLHGEFAFLNFPEAQHD